MTTSYGGPSIEAIEADAVAALVAAGITELDGWVIESLWNQVDWEKDQLNINVRTLLVAAVEVNHLAGYTHADPVRVAFVAVVPGVNQQERRILMLNALKSIAGWMREGETPYQPERTITERIHPFAMGTLTATLIG